MSKKELTPLNQLLQIIDGHKLNKAHLASKIGMNNNTFKLKLNNNFPQYKLTEEEQDKLIAVLKEMAEDIQNNFDMTFNNALAKITRKKI